MNSKEIHNISRDYTDWNFDSALHYVHSSFHDAVFVSNYFFHANLFHVLIAQIMPITRTTQFIPKDKYGKWMKNICYFLYGLFIT